MGIHVGKVEPLLVVTPRIPKQKFEFKSSERLVGSYKAFLDTLKPNADVVYIPSCGVDTSHEEAFPKTSRLYCVDVDKGKIQELRRRTHGTNVKAFYDSAQSFDLRKNSTQDADVLILIDPVFNIV